MLAEVMNQSGAGGDVRETRQSVRWLVDNAAAYDALLDAIDNARRFVWMSQLAFDADCVAYHDSDNAVDTVGRRLADAVISASTTRGVDVRILLNASLLLDTTAALRAYFRNAGAGGVQVRGVSRFPQLLHAKVVVIDGAEAFLLGSPFANGYWDDTRHLPVDARRPLRELGGRPLHDLSCTITGPAVAAVEELFTELWNDVSSGPGEHDLLPRAPSDAYPPGAICVASTAPRRALRAHPDGVAGILAEIEAGLAAAQSLVYIEHQYLSARPVIAALSAALARAPGLEVIMVLNQNPDVTAYRGWQNALLREAGLLDHPRVGLFALWSAKRRVASPPRWDVNQLFVHSKVLLVDDVWATVGSANLDGVSLHSYGDDFAGFAGRWIFRHVRNFDINAVFYDRDDALAGAVRELRKILWHEHLGIELDQVTRQPEGEGWLSTWRARAARNVAALAGGDDAPPYGSFVLPYNTRSTPRAQLADVGIDASEVQLHFNPGWLEVHCSPNWMRNVFA